MRQIDIVLKTPFLRCRCGVLEQKGFNPIAPSEKPFQGHDHLTVWRDVFQPVQIRIGGGDALACGDVLRITEHHGAFNGERHEIPVDGGQEFSEESPGNGFCVPDDAGDGFGLAVVVVRPHGECGKAAEEKQNQVADTRMCFQKTHVSMPSSSGTREWRVRPCISRRSGVRRRNRVFAGVWTVCCRKAVLRDPPRRPAPGSCP